MPNDVSPRNAAQERTVPRGELSLRTVAMPADTNGNGDIFGGWLLSQMDIGGGTVHAPEAAAEIVGEGCR